jgi:hypothetical protein
MASDLIFHIHEGLIHCHKAALLVGSKFVLICRILNRCDIIVAHSTQHRSLHTRACDGSHTCNQSRL